MGRGPYGDGRLAPWPLSSQGLVSGVDMGGGSGMGDGEGLWECCALWQLTTGRVLVLGWLEDAER